MEIDDERKDNPNDSNVNKVDANVVDAEKEPTIDSSEDKENIVCQTSKQKIQIIENDDSDKEN